MMLATVANTNPAGALAAAARAAAPSVLKAAAASAQAAEQTRHVWTGQMRVGQDGEVLTALLGSCVGIGIVWRARGRCGLAHCFLPEGAGSGVENAGRYVSTAIPALLAAMGVRREHYGEVEVIVAGGAHMLRSHGNDSQVGRRNVAAARAELAQRGLNVVFEDIGGSRGRRISIDCATQSHEVQRVGAAEAWA